MPRITIRYERKKLYEEVWNNAVTKVAKAYGVSDVALRKVCKKLAVPLPPLGYWAKLAAGKKLPTPPLPAYSGPTQIVSERFVSRSPEEPEPEDLIARREFESKPENRIVVSEALNPPHPLVVATKQAFRQAKRRHQHDKGQPEFRPLDISVSDASIPRALRIMDALAKAFDARGMPLRIIQVKG